MEGKMSKTITAFLIALVALPALAKKHSPEATCQTKFTVVQEDHLKNITQGLSKKDTEWFKKKVEKKYPDVCYVAPSPKVPLVFFISVTPAVYHGTRVVRDTQTHNAPVNATVTDENGNTSNVSGTVQQTTTSSTAVPYTHEYSAFTLSVKQMQLDGTAKVLRRFQQAELVLTWSLNTKAANNKRFHKVIEEAAEWVHEGGLTNPLETVAPQ
jgi:hypothetical protein